MNLSEIITVSAIKQLPNYGSRCFLSDFLQIPKLASLIPMDEIDGFLPESQIYHQSDLVVFVLDLLNEGKGEMWTLLGDTELC